MSKLPRVEYSDGLQKRTQRRFGGLNATAGAAETDIFDMENLSAKDFPVLSVRERRYHWKTLMKPNGIYAWDGIVYVDGTELYYRDKFICEVTDSEKTFCGIGNYVVILPDKMWIHTETLEHGYMGAETSAVGVIFGNGTLYGEQAECNMIQKVGMNWEQFFKVGDAITITGCSKHPKNNKTPIIREIDGDKLYFYEYAFELEGEQGNEAYAEQSRVRFERVIPDMDYICESENRLWGCKGNDIYASKLGDIFNWNVFDGLSTDSYAVTVGSAGKFTGCTAYGGYAVFFKPDHIYKMYGSYPAAYRLMGSATLGLDAGSEKSPAVAGETMFFLSRAGFTAYTGGVPNPIGAVFGNEKLRNAVGGSDGLHYYVSAEREDGNHRVYVFDTQSKLWHIEDSTNAMGFAWYANCLYMLSCDGRIWVIGKEADVPEGCTKEGRIKWFAEFADADAGRPESKGVNKVRIRLELERNSEAEVFVMFDSDGYWQRCGRFDTYTKTSHDCPIPLRRCDHYRVKIAGIGGAKLYSLEKQFYLGEDGRTI